MLQLRITLLNVKPSVWRHVIINANLAFLQLHRDTSGDGVKIGVFYDAIIAATVLLIARLPNLLQV